jgi:hypothetical protein
MVDKQMELREEARESQRLGLGLQFWPVHRNYKVDDDGVIRPVEDDELLYLPMAKPALPFELAKVAPGDEAAALRFVGAWGLLGHQLLVPRERWGGDALQFLWGHASTVKALLKLLHAIEQGDAEALAGGPITPALITRSSKTPVPALTYWSGAQCIVDSFVDGRSPAEAAASPQPLNAAYYFVAEILSKNLASIHPSISRSRDTDGRSIALRRSFRWRNLLDVVYWHVWNRVESKNRPLAICKECDGLFIRTDARQLFCPPPEAGIQPVRAGVRAQSLCGLKYHQREMRKKKGDLKDGAQD